MASVTAKWICQSCSCHNHSSSSRCTVCNTSRPTDLYYPAPRQSPRLAGGGLSHPASLRASEAGISSSDVIIDQSPARYRPSSILPVMQGRDGRGEWGTSGGGPGAHQSKWVCFVCTYGNWPNSKHCTMCNALRRQHHKLSPQVGGDGVPGGVGSSGGNGGGGGGGGAGVIGDSILDYVPRHLDYVASPGAVGGGMYDEIRVPHHSQHARDSTSNRSSAKPRKKSSVDNRSGQRKWKCSKCTYENWARAGKCIMCQTTKNKTPSPPMSDSETSHSPNPATKHHHPSSPSENANSSSSLASLSSSSLHARSLGINSNQPPSSASPAHTDSSPSAVHLIPCTAAGTSTDVLPSSSLKSTSNEVRQIRNRLSSSDWLFINACLGVVNEDVPAVKAYLRGEGDRARQLGRDECLLLGQPSIFSVGSTLVHLAIR